MAGNAAPVEPLAAEVGYVAAQIITADGPPLRVVLFEKPGGKPIQVTLVAVTGSGRMAFFRCKVLDKITHVPAQLVG